MTKRISMTAAIAAVLLVTGLGSAPRAWVGERDTLTFSKDVAIPGAVLPAGSYVFEVMTSDGSGGVVRVANLRGNHTYFMGFTRAVDRPASLPKDRLVTLGETKAGTPPQIAVWYPIGDTRGHGFIY